MSRFTAQPPCFGWLPLVSLAFCAVTQAAEPPAFTKDQIAFFERDVRPLLVENCQKCHGATSAKLGLRLDSRDGVLKGSDYRPVVDLENPDRSVLLHAVRHTGETIGGGSAQMPDKGPRLQPKGIAALAEWIRQGLPWPAEKAPAKIDPKTHWAYQPLQKVEIPAGDGNPIDRFECRAGQSGLGTGTGGEDPATLYHQAQHRFAGAAALIKTFRHLSPTPTAMPGSGWSRGCWVPRLPGERWARHWMDVARCSDTKGYEAGGRERRFIFLSHLSRLADRVLQS
ncbi:MAG: c-type cytochrome domain-containing protein [Verrucomicrobiales bacterium]